MWNTSRGNSSSLSSNAGKPNGHACSLTHTNRSGHRVPASTRNDYIDDDAGTFIAHIGANSTNTFASRRRWDYARACVQRSS